MPKHKNNLLEWFHKQYKIEDKGYETSCWIWQLCLHTSGYAKFSYKNITYRGHIWIWEIVNNIKHPGKGFDLHHKCEMKTCVNPEHLELLTRKEHIQKTPNNIFTANIHNKLRSSNGKSI